MFDDASVLECYRRAESIVPQQALAVSNSRLALSAAARINARLHERLGEVSDCGVHPGGVRDGAGGDADGGRAEGVCGGAEGTEGGAEGAARRGAAVRGDLIQALVNHNDFITVR